MQTESKYNHFVRLHDFGFRLIYGRVVNCVFVSSNWLFLAVLLPVCNTKKCILKMREQSLPANQAARTVAKHDVAKNALQQQLQGSIVAQKIH